MSKITIPPAALEAGAEAFLECDRSPACSFEDALRAAFLAMIEAWPGMEYVFRQPTRYSVCYSKPAIILPLPQQDSDE